MKASEAEKLSTVASNTFATENKKKAEKARLDRIRQEKEKRAKFQKDLSEGIARNIAYAVKDGKKDCSFSMWPSEDTPVRAKQHLEEHGYSDIIKREENKLRKDGYRVSHQINSSEHWTSHAYILIEWGKKNEKE